jgi:hypothetical protein
LTHAEIEVVAELEAIREERERVVVRQRCERVRLVIS